MVARLALGRRTSRAMPAARFSSDLEEQRGLRAPVCIKGRHLLVAAMALSIRPANNAMTAILLRATVVAVLAKSNPTTRVLPKAGHALSASSAAMGL